MTFGIKTDGEMVSRAKFTRLPVNQTVGLIKIQYVLVCDIVFCKMIDFY